MMSLSFRRVAATLAVVVACTAWTPAHQENADVLYQEARRLFDALEYDKAVSALDQAIGALSALAPEDPVRRERLASAYEMRARAKFGVGDQDGAKADFVLLLKLSPPHVLAGQVSPRVVALFEETAAATVTDLTVSVTPATANLELDGTPLTGPGTIKVVIGEHVVTADQPGYRSATETVNAVAGAPVEVTLALERLSSVVRIVTTPPDVDVRIDGVAVGRTAEGPSAGGPSAALVVGDVATGTRSVELRRECFVPVTQRLEVGHPDDYSIGPITLEPAVATLSVTADQAGAQVFVDGQERGTAPLELADLCEGEHLVELRTRFGADSQRIDVRAGTRVSVEGILKPVFAIVSVSGPAAASAQDLRVIVERAFAGSRTVRLFAPPLDEAQQALKANQLSADWLATDAAGRAVGASAQIGGPLRKDGSSRMADTFKAQGVASVTSVDGSRVVVALLAAGSVAPDAVEVALNDQASIFAATAKLDRGIELSRPSIGLQVIDVADVGAVIVGVDPRGPAAAASVAAGDVIAQADGKPVTDGAALSAIVAGHRVGEALALDLRDAAGDAKRAEVKVVLTPRAIGLSEHGLLANRILLDLRARLAQTTDPFEQSVIRLNMAVALGRLGDWGAAREELQQVRLPDQRGVGNGTVQYLTGVAAENMGDRAGAVTAYTAAAGSEGLLTEDGPPVKDLADAKLAELQKGTRD